VIYKKEDNDYRHRENKVYHVLEHSGERDDIPREVHLFNYRGVTQEDHGRCAHRGAKPLPREKPGNKEEGVILHLYPHDHLEGYEIDESEGKGMDDRPAVSEYAALVPNLHLFLRENCDQVPVVLKTPHFSPHHLKLPDIVT